MITMTPVLESWRVSPAPWPVEPDFLVPVPRRPAAVRVGTVIWALVGRSVTTDELSLTATGARETVETYLTAPSGGPGHDDFAPGGLRVAQGEVVVEPGCCVGLDEWRDWFGALDGEQIDLGHDPDVWLEQRGPGFRLWQDVGRSTGSDPPDGPYLDLSRDVLRRLLGEVQADLAGFLAAVPGWARPLVGDLAEPLTAEVDRRLRITRP